MPYRAPHSLIAARRSQPAKWRRSVWIALAAAMVLAWLAMPMSLGRVYVADDLGAFHLPLRAFYADCLSAGDAFDWMPSLFCGFFLTGEGQGGTYHPLHWLLYRWLPLSLAFDLEVLLPYPIIFAGTVVLLRRWTARIDAALFGGLCFTFCSFNLLHFAHVNAVSILAHVPWLMVFLDASARAERRTVRAAAELGTVLLTGSQLLLGYPQYVWFSLLAEAAYFGLLVNRRGVRRWSWLRLPVSKLLGVMLAAVQLLPTLDAYQTAARRSWDDAFYLTGSLHPWNALQWLGPYLFQQRVVGQNTHELGIYLGAVPLLLVVWLVSQRNASWRRRKLIAGCAVLGALALWLACGRHGGIYQLQGLIPLVGSFRFPARYSVLFFMALTPVVAMAFAALVARSDRNYLCIQRPDTEPTTRLRADSSPAALWITVGLSVLLACLAPILWGEAHVAPLPWPFVGPALLAIGAWLIMCAAGGHRWAVVALVLLTAGDLGFYGYSYSIAGKTAALAEYPPRDSLPPEGDDTRCVVDLTPPDGDGPRWGNAMLLDARSRVGGYAGLEPSRQIAMTNPNAWRIASAGWVRRTPETEMISRLVEFEQPSPDQDASRLIAPEPGGADLIVHDEHWLRVKHPLPRVRLVSQTMVSQSPSRDLDRIDVSRTALTEFPLSLPPGEVGTARLEVNRPGNLQVATQSARQRLLVVSESYHPGWNLRMDGLPHRLLRVNGDFLGCVVPPGKHTVRFEFEPESVRLGWLLSWSALGLSLVRFAGRWLCDPIQRQVQV